MCDSDIPTAPFRLFIWETVIFLWGHQGKSSKLSWKSPVRVRWSVIHTKGKRGNLLAIYYTELVLAEVHCRLYCYNLHLKHVEANWRLFSLIMDHIQILTILIFQKNYLTKVPILKECHFGKMKLWAVEHFSTYLSSLLGVIAIF